MFLPISVPTTALKLVYDSLLYLTSHILSFMYILFFIPCILEGVSFSGGHTVDCLNKIVDLRCGFLSILLFLLAEVLPQSPKCLNTRIPKHGPVLLVGCLQEFVPTDPWVFPHFLPFALSLASPPLTLLSAVTLQVCALCLHTLGALFSQQGRVRAQQQFDMLVFCQTFK